MASDNIVSPGCITAAPTKLPYNFEPQKNRRFSRPADPFEGARIMNNGEVVSFGSHAIDIVEAKFQANEKKAEEFRLAEAVHRVKV